MGLYCHRCLARFQRTRGFIGADGITSSVANAKIIDLALAKGTIADNGSLSEISIQGAFAGTPTYASPEQFAGVGADIRSDLYSLGITLWETLAGEVPFKGSTSRLIYQHQHATPPVDKLTHVPQPVIVLVEILLCRGTRRVKRICARFTGKSKRLAPRSTCHAP
jgi:serine/threonine protein kinase